MFRIPLVCRIVMIIAKIVFMMDNNVLKNKMIANYILFLKKTVHNWFSLMELYVVGKIKIAPAIVDNVNKLLKMQMIKFVISI